MQCFDDNLAGAFVDGLLDRARRGEVEDHLDTCRACRVLLSEIGRALAPTIEDGGEPGAGSTLGAGALVGRYIVVSLVGVGGMGEVYAAFDPKLERRVALKLIRHDRAESDSATRMLKEARALAQLAHPNIVTVFDVGSVPDGIFIAMELLEGGSLARWRETRETPIAERLDLLSLAGRGLATAHAAGLVHRDVKPENVLLGESGRCCIADFGLVEDRVSTRDLRVLAGTPAYLAPECQRGEPADARSDQFSFAVMAYELLFGTHPFEGATSEEHGAAIATGRRRRPPGVGLDRRMDGARRVFERAMTSDRAGRFPSMDAMLRELDPARKTPMVAILVGALGLAVLVAFGYRAGTRARPELCVGSEAGISAIWNGERALRVRDAFRATRRPYAERAADAVIASLDAQARAWGAEKRASCEATRLTGSQSDAMYELRNRCFARRLRDVDALVAVLAAAEPQTVDEAVAAADALAAAASCDPARAPNEPARPSTPAIASAERAIASASALTRAGQPKKALAATRAASAEARVTGDRTLLAEALTAQGEVELDAVQLGPATKTLDEAILLAEASGREAWLVRALTLLARVEMLQPEVARAGQHLARANAVLERMHPPDAALRDEWTSAHVFHLLASGDAAGAVAVGRRHVADLEARIGPTGSTTTSARIRLGQAFSYSGAVAEARDAETRILEAQRAALGDEHPKTAAAHRRLGEALAALESWDAAILHARASVRILAELFGEDSTQLVSAFLLLGTVLDHAGDPEGAPLLARGLAIEERTFGPKHPSVALALMADVERRLEHADARGAEPLAARALAIWRATVGEEHFETIAASVLLGRARADLGHDAEPLLRAALAYFDTHPARATAVGDAAFALARALSRKTPRSSAETAETAEIDALLARARARYRAGGSKARATALDTWENSHGR